MAGSEDRPISPWAERFGVSESYPWKEENKSGLHPTHPEIDARYPEALTEEALLALRTTQALPVPSYPQLDRLLLDERHQRTELEGYFVWQAVLFGALRDTQPMSTTIDETNWLPLFAKQRWYNLDRPLTDSWLGTLDSRFAADATWNVDDPVLWENLSPAIQLASHFLRATVQHPFMDAILGVNLTDLHPNNQQPEGLDQPPLLAKNNTPPLRSEQQLLDILKQYAEKVVITFMPPGMVGFLGQSYGITFNVADPNLQGVHQGYDLTVLMINPTSLWPLLDKNAPSSSRAQATLILAVTLAHEMIHVIYRVKNLLAPPGESHWDEPCYAPPGTNPTDSAWVAELGLSWEQSVIGGGMSECPKNRLSGGTTGAGLFTFAADTPNWKIWQSYGIGVDAARHEDEAWYGYALPAFVAESYCSDEFWQIGFAKYGLPALRAPQLFRTYITKNGTQAPHICPLEFALPEFRPRLQQICDNLIIRSSQWNQLRPWYNEKEDEWDKTPYCRLRLRDLAGRFRVAHRTGDEWLAQKCYRDLGVVENWGDHFKQQGFILDQDDDWIDQAAAYLMMLITPIRIIRETRRIPFFPRNEHRPSAAAIAGAIARSVRPYELALAGGSHEWQESQLDPRNTPFTPNDPDELLGNRTTLVAILRNEIQNRQRQFPIPDPLFQELRAMFNNVDRAAPQCPLPGQWLSNRVRFALPPWQGEKAKTWSGYSPSSLYEPYNHSAQPQQHVPGAATPAQQSSGGGSGPGTPESSSAHSARRRGAQSARRAATPIDETYFTVGDAGNHISTGDLWIIVDDGAHGYDVYDATDVVEEMWADDHVMFSLDTHCERTLLGLKARPCLQKNLEEQGKRMGKLILPMRRHEIAERDGRHGKPFWISVGNDVFDISNFPFESENQRELMRRCPGGNPWRDIVQDTTIDCDQLAIDLKPYRCAVVASQTPDKGPGPADEFHFTRQEVACHIYPETTMYTIIRRQVYNLTGYMEFHPGGETILRQWAGRDSTHEFEKYHSEADRCLKDYDYLRVGRLVEEKPLGQLTHNEVALNGHVYDLGRIDPRENATFFRAIDSLRTRGQDITGLLNDGLRLPPDALFLLPQRPDLITAKLSVPLADIDLATLQANNGRHIPLPKGMRVPRDRVEADAQMPLWVSYDGLVYDMSAVSKWGPEDVKAQLNSYDHRYRGAVVPPSAFATRLQQDYGCRVIGRLLMRSGRPRDEEESGTEDWDYRPFQRLRLR